MDVLKRLTIVTTQDEFHLWVHVVKPITMGHLHHAAVLLLSPPSSPGAAVLPPTGPWRDWASNIEPREGKEHQVYV